MIIILGGYFLNKTFISKNKMPKICYLCKQIKIFKSRRNVQCDNNYIALRIWKTLAFSSGHIVIFIELQDNIKKGDRHVLRHAPTFKPLRCIQIGNGLLGCFSIHLSGGYMYGRRVCCHSSCFNTDWFFSFFLSISISALPLQKYHNNLSIYFFLRCSPSYFNCISFISINYFKLKIVFKSILF